MKIKEYPYSLFKEIRINSLIGKGISNTQSKSACECTVSLTSIPSRLEKLHLTIGSLLTQSITPKKILLWLNEELKHRIPKKLNQLQSQIFEIHFIRGSSSHRKLVYSLQHFSNDVIVTCDDDVMYRKNWLEGLMADHHKHPNAIICHECREISADSNGNLTTYTAWPTITEPGYTSLQLLPIGYGGVLYPPGALHPDTTNESLYMALAPKADDLWFKAMGLLNGTTVRRCSTPCKKPVPIIGAKGNSLAQTNIKEDGNRKQWLAICEHYGLDPVTLDKH